MFVGLGSNLGDREGHIRSALVELATHPGVQVLRSSSLHETDPIGGPAGQNAYLNAAAKLDTTLSPRELLAWLHEIERRHGRVRKVRWGPRTLDLDLLLYCDSVINLPDLTVPHPRMWAREFVMVPLREIYDMGKLVARGK